MGIDPVEFRESNIHSFNRYAYGKNNPYRFVDPDGRESISIHDYPLVEAVTSLVNATGTAFAGLSAYAQGVIQGNASPQNAAMEGMSANQATSIGAAMVLVGRGAKGPIEGGGGSLRNLSAAEALRIQNAANRTGTEI